MRRFLTILLNLWIATSFGQNDIYKQFNKAEYPKEKYLIKSDSFNFNNYNIELIHVKLIDTKTYYEATFFCRTWLTVKRKNNVVDKLYIPDCEGVGGCSGIFVSPEQTRKDYFILSKFGDYNGKILIIDTSGKIKSFIGGHYYVSKDNKYLFSPYDSDLAGLTVFDFSQNKELYSADTKQSHLEDFYFYDNKYFAIARNDDKKENETDIITFDLKSNTLIQSTVTDAYINKAKRLKGYNVFTYPPCTCGRTK